MDNNPDKKAVKAANILDALGEDIRTAPIEDLLEEVNAQGRDPDALAYETRAVIDSAIQKHIRGLRQTTRVNAVPNAGSSLTSEDEEQAARSILAQFNQHVAQTLGARYASTHFHFENQAKESLVAPGSTTCGCITHEPLVSPIKDGSRFTVRLFKELLPGLEGGSRVAVYTQRTLPGKRDLRRTLHGEPFECLLAGLIEDKGRSIGVVKVENRLPETGCFFDEGASQILLDLIRESTPRLREVYSWVQKKDWSVVLFDVPLANTVG